MSGVGGHLFGVGGSGVGGRGVTGVGGTGVGGTGVGGAIGTTDFGSCINHWFTNDGVTTAWMT